MATGAVVFPPRYSVCRHRLDDAGCPLANLPAEPPSPASLAQAGGYGDTAMGKAQVWRSLTDHGDTTHLRRTSEFQSSSPLLGVCWRFAGIRRSLGYRLDFRQRKADADVALCRDYFP